MSIKRIIITLLILLIPVTTYAYRTARPIKFTDLNKPDQINQLNEILTELWNITNGRYTMPYVTTNPDGTLKGDIGDMLLLKNGANYYLEVNTTGAKIWRGVLLQDTP